MREGSPGDPLELDPTLPPTEPPEITNDKTLPPNSAPSAPVIVRAGSRVDHPELVPVDPRHYDLGQMIARGGMGQIRAARDLRLGRPVAIKELLVATSDLRARFEREARITAKLQHPAIVNVLEAGTWPGGEPFYAMKLVTGDSLDKVVARKTSDAERLALLPNVIAVADALAYAHSKRVIHRDLKPANVLVGEFGETVVIDWGLAKDLSDQREEPDRVAPYRVAPAAADETVAGSVMGTPAYMPPEQASGEPVDERADVYALGALLYHVLAGAPPFEGRSTEAVLAAVLAGPARPLAQVANVPADLCAIVDKAMARRKEDRYPTGKELADELKRFQTGQLVGAQRYTTWMLVRRWLGKHRAIVTVSSIALGIVAMLSIVGVRQIVSERDRARAGEQEAQRRLSR
jgi:serine/threonine protein kinase